MYQALEIEWCSDPTEAAILSEFFINSVTEDYISHGEIQTGRAITPAQWSPSLAQNVTDEIRETLSSQGIKDHHAGIVIVKENGIIVAIAIVNFHVGINNYCIIEDLVVAPSRRRSGVGKQILQWIEREAKQRRMSHLFLESGINNVVAHDFFHRHGFHTCAVMMMKPLDRD